MALIKCPECGKEISNKAVSCPNCGYPLNNISKEENCKYNVIITKLFDNCDKVALIGAIRGIKKWGLAETKAAIEKLPTTIFTNLDLNSAKSSQDMLFKYGAESQITKIEEPTSNRSDENHIFANYNTSMIICPHCGSTSVTTGQRGFSLFSGFLGSNKTVNRCGSCGWTWKPRR